MKYFSFATMRLVLLFLILAATVLTFQVGVEVDNIKNVPEKGFLMHILYAINLFTLGAADLGPPISGPAWAMLTLYVMYFLAPIISVAAIIEAIFMSTNLRLWFKLWRGRHAVIIGAGRVGSSLPSVLRKQFGEGLPVVVADKNPDPLISNLMRASTCRADASDPGILKRLSVSRAKCVFALTNNQWLNLGVYHAARKAGIRNVQFFIRMDAEDLMEELQRRWAQEEQAGKSGPPVRMFNVHIQAVNFLFSENSYPATQDSGTYTRISNDVSGWMEQVRKDPPHIIALLGFGRFGQHFVQQFIRPKNSDINQNLEKAVIISKNAENELAHYRLFESGDGTRDIQFDMSLAARPFGSHTVSLITAAGEDKRILWVLGTNDEALNMDAATWINRHYELSGKRPQLLIRTSSSDAASEIYSRPEDISMLLLPSYDVIGHYFEKELATLNTKTD